MIDRPGPPRARAGVDRRDILAGGAATAAALAIGAGAAFATTARRTTGMSRENHVMAYELPPLPYAYDALEPVIDAETMRLHHDRHHRAYIDALNGVIADRPGLQGKTIEDLLRGLDAVPESIRRTVRDQGGGHANHQFFWKIMTPGGSPMPADLARRIDTDFGSLGAMKARFEEAGAKHFGSGWVFLVFDVHRGALEILSLPDQDSLLLLDGKPGLLCNDLWEHAYYLKHRDRRPDYLKGWWDVVHWSYVGERLRGIFDGKKQL